MKMYWDKSCYNSFCEPAATERRSKKLTDFTDAHGVFDTDFGVRASVRGESLPSHLPSPLKLR